MKTSAELSNSDEKPRAEAEEGAGSHLLSVWIPVLPPSDNSLYIIKPVRKKGKKGPPVYRFVLTDVADKYKQRVIRGVSQLQAQMGEGMRPHRQYLILIKLYFDPEEVMSSASWNQHKTRPFKKIDGSNRQKLVTDAVTDGLSEDKKVGDETLFRYLIEKNIAYDGITGVEVTICHLSDEVEAAWQHFTNLLQSKEVVECP